MRYKKGTFIITPNIDFLDGKPAVYQSIFMWLNKYADDDGICFPTRSKLAQNVGCTRETLDKYIEMMEKDGIISKTVRRKAGSKENTSNLYQILILGEETTPPSVIIPATPSVNFPAETVSSINSTTEEDTSSKITLNPAQGKSPVSRLQSLYGLLFKHLYGFKPKPTTFPQTGGVFKQLLKDYSEIQVACLLIVFFNWQGMNDREPKEKDWLVGQTHSIYLFKGSVSKYEAYVRNVAGWSEEFDNDLKLYDIVRKKIGELSTGR